MAENPWLKINISDYVNHMSSPEVGQYQLINECFKSVLNKYNPKRIFVPGCTIGNGFEYINWGEVESVTALDINPDFLNILGNSFPGQEKLEIINEDIVDFDPEESKFDLIFAALIFEYVDPDPALMKIKKVMDTNSTFFSMIQLPGKSKVTKTEYKSLEKLSPVMHLLSIDKFQSELKRNRFSIKLSEKKTLKNGKSFLLTEAGINSQLGIDSELLSNRLIKPKKRLGKAESLKNLKSSLKIKKVIEYGELPWSSKIKKMLNMQKN